MKINLVFSLLMISFFSMQVGAQYPATTPFSKCQMAVNSMLFDYGAGVDPDGMAFFLDQEGKVQISNQKNVVNRKVDGQVETIGYLTQKVMATPSGMKTVPLAQVTQIHRDKAGRVTKFVKISDVKATQAQGMYPNQLFEASSTSEFQYNEKGECEINQRFSEFKKDSKDKNGEVWVTYDRKLCEQIEPMIRQIGAQSASHCASLITETMRALGERANELKKENKSVMGLPKNQMDVSIGNLSLGSVINDCAVAASLMNPGGYFGGGPYGYGGYGNFGGGYGQGMSPNAPQPSPPKGKSTEKAI